MAMVDDVLLHRAPGTADELRARLDAADGPLLGCAVGMADSEPWRKVAVGVTAARILWLDLTSGSCISATHDAVARVGFLTFEAPPWPVYLEVDVHPDAGTVTVAGPGAAPETVEGHRRTSAVHRSLDTVRLACDDACALELVVRDARAARTR
jgi:hypothetical protein